MLHGVWYCKFMIATNLVYIVYCTCFAIVSYVPTVCYVKGKLYPKPELSMLFVLSQSYQHCFRLLTNLKESI